MKHTWKRLTALLLALAMCLSMLPASALAAETDGDEGGLYSDESDAGGGVSAVSEASDTESGISAVSDDTTILDSGTCGDDLTWTLDSDYALTISGTGAMTEWSSDSDIPWYSYRSSITSVTIDDSVTTIGSRAFYYCSKLTSVTIPDSVT
ncbi:MAG: leucine-rich repeat domain-containing protein, partial [Clostridiales bacterium]|nr:leucine-rich repeat domain-containing protein [Clostridiales bacterium]